MPGLATSLILTAACAPARLQLPPPALQAVEPAGQPVQLSYPVDLRPPAERRDAPYYVGTFPVGQVVYGDAQLRPGALDAIDRDLQLGLQAAGVPQQAGAGIVVHTWVLAHAGIRDASDAQWVSTISGGTTGLISKLIYPSTFAARVHLRVLVEDAQGHPLALRDVRAHHVNRAITAHTWGIWYPFGPGLTPRLFTDAFERVHEEIAVETGRIVDQARRRVELSAGEPPVETPYAGMRSLRAPDSISPGLDPSDPIVADRYPARRFSVVTGHDTTAGEVVGTIGLPLDTFGYEVGLSDDLQLGLGITLLVVAPYLESYVPYVEVGEVGGVYDTVGLDLRAQLLCWRASCVSAELGGGVDSAILDDGGIRAVLGGARARSRVLFSLRPGPITWFGTLGSETQWGLASLEPLVTPGLGRTSRLHLGPGAEMQLTPTMALAAELQLGVSLVDGQLPEHDRWTELIRPLPQLTLGLR